MKAHVFADASHGTGKHKPGAARPGIMLALAAGMGLVLAGCGRSRPPDAALAAAPPAKVRVVRVIAARLHFLTPLPGELRPYQDVRLRARVEGFVKRLFVDRGTRVRQGQTLARLSAPDLRAKRAAASQALAVARARWQAARANLLRDRSTLRRLQSAARLVSGSIAGNDIQVAQQTVAADRAQALARRAAIHGAAAELRSLRALTGYLRVTAPFSGMIVKRYISVGSLVGPSAQSPALFRLQQLNPLRLVVEVPETEAAGIYWGKHVRFRVPAYPGRLFSGVIARIPDSLHQATRIMPVELNVANSQWVLSPGMYAQVRWPVQRPHPTLLVPASAVAATTQETFVDLIQRGRIHWVSVHRGFTVRGMVEVFGDLCPGQTVALRGTGELPSGTRVRATVVKSGIHTSARADGALGQANAVSSRGARDRGFAEKGPRLSWLRPAST